MTGETKPTTLAAALVKAQSEMPAVPKTKEVSTGKFSYKYATLDDLIAATLPILNQNGLAIVQLPCQTDSGMPGLRTTIIHESGEELSAIMPLSPGSGMQELGSAITYMRRYAWSAALGIASEHDDDGQASSNRGAEPVAATSAREDAGYRDPSADQRSEAQAKMLFGLCKRLGEAGKITEPQFIAACVQAGSPGATVADCIAGLSKQAASGLITRLKNLEENTVVEPGPVPAANASGYLEDDSIPFAPTIDGMGG